MDIKIYYETNKFLGECFHSLEEPIPSPVSIQCGDDLILRYQKKHHCRQLAIVQKLARYISGLNASLLLIESGFTQETVVIFRTLNEFFEDVLFLIPPITGGVEGAEKRKKYLEEFFQEEFNNPNQKRKTMHRGVIRKAIARVGEIVPNPNEYRRMLRHLEGMYSVSSGYVHAPSCYICEMVDGDHLHYCLTGMIGTPVQSACIYAYRDYVFRGLSLVIMVAEFLGNTTVRKKAIEFLKCFDKTTGESGSGDFEKFMKELKRKNT